MRAYDEYGNMESIADASYTYTVEGNIGQLLLMAFSQPRTWYLAR